MGEIRSKTCEGGELTKNQLADHQLQLQLQRLRGELGGECCGAWGLRCSDVHDSDPGLALKPIVQAAQSMSI